MQRRLSAAVGLVFAILSGCQQKAENAGDTATEAMAAAEAAANAETAVNPAGLGPCEILGRRRVTQEDCDLAKATDEEVKDGVAAFNWPQQMRRGKPVMLRLAVEQAPPPPQPPPTDSTSADAGAAPDGAAANETAAPAGAARPPATAALAPPPSEPTPSEPTPTPQTTVADLPGAVVSYKPLVGRYMSAKLSGDSFDVVAKSDEHQEVLRDSVTHWDWLVTPKAGGTHTLTITTQVEFKDSGGNYIPLRFRPETRKIEVKVPIWLWVRDALDALPGWIKAVTTVVSALAALVAAWVGLRAALKGKKPAADAGPAPS